MDIKNINWLKYFYVKQKTIMWYKVLKIPHLTTEGLKQLRWMYLKVTLMLM